MAKVVISSSVLGAALTSPLPRLEAAGHTYTLRLLSTASDVSAYAEILQDAEAILLGAGTVDAAMLDAAPRLRAISIIGAGYDAVDLRAATERGIAVSNVRGANAGAVAELAMGLIVCLARRVFEMGSALRDGRWLQCMGHGVAGRTLGIVGTGAIGVELARRAAAFGMPIVAYSRTPNASLERTFGLTYLPTLEGLLVSADVVSLHLPLTAATQHLLGARELAMMRPGSYLINTARAGLVDSRALHHALREGPLAGAALDVHDEEPPTSFDLIRLPNVLATPHIGSLTSEAMTHVAETAIANVCAMLDGADVPTLLTPARGAQGDTNGRDSEHVG